MTASQTRLYLPRSVYSGLPCEERERLLRVYLAAVDKYVAASEQVSDVKGLDWQQATKDTREDCEVALAELNRHKAEHGC